MLLFNVDVAHGCAFEVVGLVFASSSHHFLPVVVHFGGIIGLFLVFGQFLREKVIVVRLQQHVDIGA